MPTPLKTSDLINNNEGVLVNQDRQAFINAGANDTTLSPSDKERILTEWAKWKEKKSKIICSRKHHSFYRVYIQ